MMLLSSQPTAGTHSQSHPEQFAAVVVVVVVVELVVVVVPVPVVVVEQLGAAGIWPRTQSVCVSAHPGGGQKSGGRHWHPGVVVVEVVVPVPVVVVPVPVVEVVVQLFWVRTQPPPVKVQRHAPGQPGRVVVGQTLVAPSPGSRLRPMTALPSLA